MKLRALISGFLGLWLFLGFFVSLPVNSTAMAAEQPTLTVAELPQTIAAEDEVKTAVDGFLQAIPRGYYTVKKVKALKNLMKGRRQALLVDVREPSEYNSGHIAGAINLPLRTLTQNLDQIPKNQPVVLYCTTGYRTAMGVMSLRLLGYDNVRGFPPSIQGWKEAGEPVER
jgi:rhodanese-related sulfurtransferase